MLSNRNRDICIPNRSYRMFFKISKNIATADKEILGVGCMMHAQYIYVRLKALLRAREKAKGLLLYIHFKY